MDLQTALPTNNIEPSLELPIAFSNRIYRGRKKIIMVDFTINKMQWGLQGIVSILYRRLILAFISENISGLMLKNHNKENKK